jgi:amino acid transporter
VSPPDAAPGGSLRPGQLGTADLTASTVANIGPGIDFYFGFGVVAVTAGVGAPLTILAAALAVFLLARGVAEFSRTEPSAGSFIEFVESGLGPVAGVATAVLVAVGYTIAMAGVFTMSGGFIAITLAHYGIADIAWGPLTVVITLAALVLMVRGIRLSTSAVAGAVVLQVTIMVIACVVILIDHRDDLSGAPFHWSAVTGGIGGLSAGFPLALYMFIGWENGPALAEECREPRTTVPRALMASVAIATMLFLLFAYATVTGFGYDVSSIGRSSIPFLTVADRALGPFAVVAWVAGIVSVLATLVSGSNAQSRMLYDAGRTGKLPRWLGVIRPSSRTPARALTAFVGVGLAVIGGWALVHTLGVGTASMDPVGLYAECSTLGTIVILFVYVLTMASLPVYAWRRHRDQFSVVRHLVLPSLGAAALVIPFVTLCTPGQPAPYDGFPFAALAIVVIAFAAGWVVVHHHRRATSLG